MKNEKSGNINLNWSFGFTCDTKNIAYSLQTSSRDAIFYASSHTGVIHDLESNKQYLLQGHRHAISAAVISDDKRYIITCDIGDASLIIVWDSFTYKAIHVIDTAKYGGITSLDITIDANYICGISQNYPQSISVWDLQNKEINEPMITSMIENYEYQHFISFNPINNNEIITNGKSKILFWKVNENDNYEKVLTSNCPDTKSINNKKDINNFTQSTFIPNTTQVVTATDSGYIIMWDYQMSVEKAILERILIKSFKITKQGGISLISTLFDKYIVCGCNDGSIRFYDLQFKVLSWFEHIKSGDITSLSFSSDSTMLDNENHNIDEQVTMDNFQIPNFIIATIEGKIIAFNQSIIQEIDDSQRIGKTLITGFDSTIYGLSVHPNKYVMATGTKNGHLILWT